MTATLFQDAFTHLHVDGDETMGLDTIGVSTSYLYFGTFFFIFIINTHRDSIFPFPSTHWGQGVMQHQLWSLWRPQEMVRDGPEGLRRGCQAVDGVCFCSFMIMFIISDFTRMSTELATWFMPTRTSFYPNQWCGHRKWRFMRYVLLVICLFLCLTDNPTSWPLCFDFPWCLSPGIQHRSQHFWGAKLCFAWMAPMGWQQFGQHNEARNFESSGWRAWAHDNLQFYCKQHCQKLKVNHDLDVLLG